jgi:hypothetical protein
MTKRIAPHLMAKDGVPVRFVCTQSFATLSGPSRNLAFRKHVESAHSEEKRREAARAQETRAETDA